MFFFAFFCNGRAWDSVAKQKHRPNRKKCPKIVYAVPRDNSWPETSRENANRGVFETPKLVRLKPLFSEALFLPSRTSILLNF